MNLPFGLKQKPLAHYVTHGVIKFSCKEGKLFYTWIWITNQARGTIRQGEVTSKEHLKHLLSIKHVDDRPTIEVVE